MLNNDRETSNNSLRRMLKWLRDSIDLSLRIGGKLTPAGRFGDLKRGWLISPSIHSCYAPRIRWRRDKKPGALAGFVAV
ncbi:hypothetical protein ADIMK_0877 [Marinobacterium lacunae]|uniref:Uncharacterized protein n=1 Tax=Marinobacterium lacunae TaxID=1232683 RepID=A0A081G320_9GAMM|nr:hypothetical protein ADIMK_0877 [Marinobacterium lacunae]